MIHAEKAEMPKNRRRTDVLLSRVQKSLDHLEGTLAEVHFSMHPFKERLKKWTGMEEAAALMGRELGIYPAAGKPSEDQENAIRAALYAMGETGVLTIEFDVETKDDRVRWSPNVKLT